MLDKDKIEFLYSQLGKRIRKNFRGMDVAIYVVGGANLTVMTDFRETTHDIDIIKQRSIDLRDIVLEMEESFGLEHNWLNDSVMFSSSFSLALRKYVSNTRHYGPLSVHYISLPAICAMKLRANRVERPDLEDALLVCGECVDVIPSDISTCYTDLYGEDLSTTYVSMLTQFKYLCAMYSGKPIELLNEIKNTYLFKPLPEAIELVYLLRKHYE